MRRGSKCISLVLSVMLVMSGIWLGSRIGDRASNGADDRQTRMVSGKFGNAETTMQMMENLLGDLLILDVAIPPCIAAGYLTAQEIKKTWRQSVHRPK